MAQYLGHIQHLQYLIAGLHTEFGIIKKSIGGHVDVKSIFDSEKDNLIKHIETKVTNAVDAIDFKGEIEKRISGLETKMELFVSKLVKDRIDFAIQNLRAQILNDFDLRIEELKEDVSNMIPAPVVSTIASLPIPPPVPSPTPVASTPPPPLVPPQAPQPPPLSETALGDIDALTKDISLTHDSDSEINFGAPNKKKVKKNRGGGA